MKKFVSAFFVIALAAGAILNQGCEDSSKNNALNQKIDELSKKVDAVLQNQAQLQQVELKSQQDAIVSRIGSDNYYYTTNLLANVNDYHFRINLALENDLKGQISELKGQLDGIEKQIKPRYGGDFETLGDKVNEIKRTTDQLKLTIEQIENDNQKIRSKLGIIY